MARILYIDDQVAAQKLIESLLTGAGHKVTLSGDGHDGIEKMQVQGFDLIITDAIMPGGVSGFDVTKTIRKQFGPDKLPIILLTGRRERRDVERAIEAGVSDYVLKPVDPSAFVAKVDAALRAVATAAAAAATESRIEVPMSEIARVHTPVNVTSLSERGLTLRSSQPFTIGGDIDLGAEFFKKIGLDIAPALQVAACEALPAGQYRVQVTFNEINDKAVSALRLWISFNHARKVG